jgi:uncharacterized protein YukE
MSSVESARLVVREELAGAGATINGMAEGIADELRTLAGLLVPLQEAWTGTAAGNHENVQLEWNNAANGLFGPEGVLGVIAAAMNVSWNNYAEAELANASTWRQT